MDLQQLTQMYDFTGRTFVVTGGTGVLGGEVVSRAGGGRRERRHPRP